MRAQLSLEVLAYISLSGVSLLFIANTLRVGMVHVTYLLSEYQVSSMVSKLNSAALTGVAYQEFSAYLPSGMCSAYVKSGVLSTIYGNLSIADGISIPKGVFCPDGGGSVLSISYKGEYYILNRVS